MTIPPVVTWSCGIGIRGKLGPFAKTLEFKAEFGRDKVGSFDTELVQEWFQAFAMNSGVTLHVATLYGTNDHHIAESCFKALARALRAALAIDARAANEIPSTKGSLGG